MLIVVGGMDPASRFEVKRSVFDVSFNKESCLNAWAKIRSAVIGKEVTMECIRNRQVL